MKKGFTLIELLIVIAIIGMLSAMLVPNFMGARERARDAQRKSDLKQIQKAFEMYRQDQTPEDYPSTADLGTSLPTDGYCFNSTSPYLKSSCSNSDTIYMSKFPIPPNAGSGEYYTYTHTSGELVYKICGCLENQADPDGSSSCADCSYDNHCQTSNTCYIVTQP